MRDFGKLPLRRGYWCAASVVAGCLVIAALARAQASPSVWDGVYTAAQAKDGQTVFDSSCAECHGEDMAGREQAPALAGPPFTEKWNKATLKKLYETIEQMPPDHPKSLTTKQYTAVLAYVLSANEFPAGQAALTDDRAALADIQMTSAPPAK